MNSSDGILTKLIERAATIDHLDERGSDEMGYKSALANREGDTARPRPILTIIRLNEVSYFYERELAAHSVSSSSGKSRNFRAN